MQRKMKDYTRRKVMMQNMVVNLMQCVITRFDARHSVISDRGTQFQSVFK